MKRFFLVFCDGDTADLESLKPTEPVYRLQEDDINEEEDEVCINGDWEYVITENTNFYGEENTFCQPGDLVFEVMNEYAFYREGIGLPTSFVDSNALVGEMREIKHYIAEYLSTDSDTEKIPLSEGDLKEMVNETVRRVIKEMIDNK